MDKYRTTFDTWEKVAELYEEKYMDLDLYNDSYDLFCKLVSTANASILEVGCGPGNITRYLLNKRPDFKIEATDISANMIALAKKNCPTATFRVMDARKIGTLNKQYNAIVCGFCLPYLSETDFERLAKDFNSLIQKNGILYLSFMEGDYEKSGYQAGSSGHKAYFYYHSLELVKKQLIQNDITVINVLHVAFDEKDTHTILIAQKNS